MSNKTHRIAFYTTRRNTFLGRRITQHQAHKELERLNDNWGEISRVAIHNEDGDPATMIPAKHITTITIQEA